MAQERLEVKIYKIGIWPVLYMLISVLTQYVAMGILCVKELMTMGEGRWVSVDDTLSLGERFEQIYNNNSSFISLVSICLTLPVLFYYFVREEKKRKYVQSSYKEYQYAWIVALGCSACVGLSRLVSLLPFDRIGQDYAQVEKVLFGRVFWVQIATVCVLIPVAEELIYRGMVFKRLRDYMPKEGSILVSALIFGVFHFNAMQGVYAFGIGILCAYVYEKYGNIFSAMLLHISANSFSVFLNKTGISNFFSRNIIVYIICMLIELAICAFVWYYIAYEMPGDERGQEDEQKAQTEGETLESTFDIYG